LISVALELAGFLELLQQVLLLKVIFRSDSVVRVVYHLIACHIRQVKGHLVLSRFSGLVHLRISVLVIAERRVSIRITLLVTDASALDALLALPIVLLTVESGTRRSSGGVIVWALLIIVLLS